MGHFSKCSIRRPKCSPNIWMWVKNIQKEEEDARYNREQELFQGLPSNKIAKSSIIHEEQLIAAKQRYEITKDIESYKRSTQRKACCSLHKHEKLNNDTDSD
ncbi:unnamed protein product [Didymodactylos carnosus]|uniref:Uncharacterized protein n=1 Tax=Didymodactylos carnosus TaxID=1234261 RepID=A0A813YJR8_9BILA|nr:unnamed protein product [Didymodactylos carnosus]CAF0885205.1 unnamed protein product [Didymodactylos carnosus]CAF3657156.1 unnamed protein product [Didymodactylos carnosus]CAF3670616.1 unnamed protein product [Didymodactylos carnosus]